MLRYAGAAPAGARDGADAPQSPIASTDYRPILTARVLLGPLIRHRKPVTGRAAGVRLETAVRFHTAVTTHLVARRHWAYGLASNEYRREGNNDFDGDAAGIGGADGGRPRMGRLREQREDDERR